MLSNRLDIGLQIFYNFAIHMLYAAIRRITVHFCSSPSSPACSRSTSLLPVRCSISMIRRNSRKYNCACRRPLQCCSVNLRVCNFCVSVACAAFAYHPHPRQQPSPHSPPTQRQPPPASPLHPPAASIRRRPTATRLSVHAPRRPSP